MDNHEEMQEGRMNGYRNVGGFRYPMQFIFIVVAFFSLLSIIKDTTYKTNLIVINTRGAHNKWAESKLCALTHNLIWIMPT